MINEPYQPDVIEEEAQSYWTEHQLFNVQENLSKEKFYCLGMFPYPSGNLHMGHVRVYTIADVVSRYHRMLDKNVLYPMGWDAFGLPAENAAIENNIPPAKWTRNNINQMREQLKRLGFSCDWKRELATYNPKYYRWEQWFFLKLLEKGLIYKKNAKVNWDPIDQTVLANEQVVDGKGWRSGAPVEQREIPMWFIKITAYADELLNDLRLLDDWPKQVSKMQENWIGRSEGVEIFFSIEHPTIQRLKVFTTRIDTLFGATYLTLSPDHALAQEISKSNNLVARFIKECRTNLKVSEVDLETIEKKGVFTGIYAIHPLTEKKIPIWIGNFVIMEYGTGAIMSVPAHDQRDWEFAKKYNLDILQVIKPANESHDFMKSPYTDDGYLVNSDQFSDFSSQNARDNLAKYLEEKELGKRKVYFRLRDWSISRQRYWGTPIPIINCPQCGAVPVPEKDLPVILPVDVSFQGVTSPLNQIPEFYHAVCPKCGGEAFRETDTFDTFINSSWYYARFACLNQENAMLDDRAKYWTPVDYYVGGIEHAVLHLLYARFFHKVMRDEGLLNSKEPFKKLLTLGMVLNKGKKMSKSKGNAVSPVELVNTYGADTVRLFIMFAAPPEQTLEWSEGGVEGANRFLKKLWSFSNNNEALEFYKGINKKNINPVVHWEASTQQQKEMRREIYNILKQINFDYQRSQFNTVVSSCMKLLNSLIKFDQTDIIDKFIITEGYMILLKSLSPICPHITHYLWFKLGNTDPITDSQWPKVIKDAIKTEFIKYVIQINGKLRGQIEVSCEEETTEIEKKALQDKSINQYISNKKFIKSIVVPDRKLINLVFSEK